jgi:hypothetical protein
MSVRTTALAVAVTLTATACSEAPTEPAGPTARETAPSFLEAGATLETWLGAYPDPASPAPGGAILVGAGDIAECYHGNPPPQSVDPAVVQNTAAERTARLVERVLERRPDATPMTAGDNAYQFGLLTPDYKYCYDLTWGRFKDPTRPSAGNHEYMSAATGYFAYFGPKTNPPLGYYSYDLGSDAGGKWHVIVLNSTPQVYLCYPPELSEAEDEAEDQSWWQELWPTPQLEREPRSRIAGRACAGDAAQQAWLVADLRMHSNARCTLVYFHHPRFSSGSHGSHFQMQRIWDILYAYGVDVVVAAHDHNYERFAPQDLNGKRDPTFGIRQFVVGTGGGDLRSVGRPIKNSEVLFTGIHGVIGLALNKDSYGWAFIAVDGSIKDSGSGSCHDAPTLKKLPFALPS